MSSKEKLKNTFAKGICYDKLLLIFVIGCMIGTYYEQILTLVRVFLKTGDILWESREALSMDHLILYMALVLP